jgi:hypothetical protein
MCRASPQDRRPEPELEGGFEASSLARRGILKTNEVTVPRTRSRSLVALLGFALLAGCDLRVTTPPSFEPQVINLRNDFALQVSGLDDFTSDVEYSWVSDGTAASVNQSPTLLTGTAILFVFDGAGAQVYQRSLGENGTFATTTGVPGTWKVRLHFSEAFGNASFRLIKQ